MNNKRIYINSRYWATRAKNYEKTSWVKDERFIKYYLNMLPERNYKKVLEIGIGTGVLAQEMVKIVPMVIGIDKSQEMMAHIYNPNIRKIVADAHDLPFKDQTFDLIYMRNVLHYLDNPFCAFTEVRRCLLPFGIYLFSQVIPFHDDISEEYDWLIGRGIHYPGRQEILSLFETFDIITISEFILKRQNVNNWLNNTCTDSRKKADIIKRHRNASEIYKSLVHYIELDNNIFVDIKHLLVLTKRSL